MLLNTLFCDVKSVEIFCCRVMPDFPMCSYIICRSPIQLLTSSSHHWMLPSLFHKTDLLNAAFFRLKTSVEEWGAIQPGLLLYEISNCGILEESASFLVQFLLQKGVRSEWLELILKPKNSFLQEGTIADFSLLCRIPAGEAWLLSSCCDLF